MYIPDDFAETRPAALEALIAATPLPVLISPTSGSLVATHLPLYLQADTLRGHVARANPHWRQVSPQGESLAIFNPVEGYISPSFSPSKAETGKVVPTWNYQAVHVYGRVEFTDDRAVLRDIVEHLTTRYESGRPKPWAVDEAPADYIEALLNGIIGVVLHITRVEGKTKLSQNKSRADREGMIAGLESENPALAEAMRDAL